MGRVALGGEKKKDGKWDRERRAAWGK